MSLAAHYTYQVAPNCNVLTKDSMVMKAGTVFTDEKALGCSLNALRDMVKSGHVLAIASKAQEGGHNDDTVVARPPGVDVKAVGTGGDKKGATNGIDASKASVSADLGTSPAPAVVAPAAAPEAPAALEPLADSALIGKDLETLNALIVERGGEPAANIKAAKAVLTGKA